MSAGVEAEDRLSVAAEVEGRGSAAVEAAVRILAVAAAAEGRVSAAAEAEHRVLVAVAGRALVAGMAEDRVSAVVQAALPISVAAEDRVSAAERDMVAQHVSAVPRVLAHRALPHLVSRHRGSREHRASHVASWGRVSRERRASRLASRDHVSHLVSRAGRSSGALRFAAVISPVIAPGMGGFVISMEGGGTRPRGGSGATATTLTGPTCAARGGDIAPTDIIAACAITASIDGAGG